MFMIQSLISKGVICVCSVSWQAADQMIKLYTMMLEKDVTMLEVNPMVEAVDEAGNKKGGHTIVLVVLQYKK